MEMNREDTIHMAREANGDEAWDGGVEWVWAEVERFAALVYAEGHKDGLDDFEAGVLPAAIKAEREACAKVAEAIEKDRFDAVGDPRIREFNSQIAFAIRARGQG